MSAKAVELTAKQRNHTLSAKKKKTKKSFRYVLAQPFPRYWPQLTDDQSSQLMKFIEEIYQKHREWFKAEKSAKKMDQSEAQKSIYCGLKSSIRKLKSGNIKLLVLSADLKPRYVTNQIIIQALAHNDDIQIACVPNLSTLMQNIFNFSCYAFVINDKNWSELSNLSQWIIQIIETNFPLPDEIKSHFAKRRARSDDKKSDEEMVTSAEGRIIKGKFVNFMDGNDLNRMRQQKLVRCNETCDADINQLYLTRDNPNQRSFVPKNAVDLKPIAIQLESLNKIKSDFISLDTYDGASNFKSTQSTSNPKYAKKKSKRPLTMYKELTIHRIQNNPNKIKKIKDKKNKNKNKGKK